jgi:hypothetical protein
LFAPDRRKNDDGDFQQWVDGEPRPIIRYTVAACIENESAVTKMFTDKIEEKIKAGLLELAAPGTMNLDQLRLPRRLKTSGRPSNLAPWCGRRRKSSFLVNGPILPAPIWYAVDKK